MSPTRRKPFLEATNVFDGTRKTLKPKLRMSMKAKDTKGKQKPAKKFKLTAAEVTSQQQLFSAPRRPPKATASATRLTRSKAAPKEVDSEGPGPSGSKKKLKRRTVTAEVASEPENGSLRGLIEVTEDGVQRRISARILRKSSQMPPEEIHSAEHEPTPANADAEVANQEVLEVPEEPMQPNGRSEGTGVDDDTLKDDLVGSEPRESLSSQDFDLYAMNLSDLPISPVLPMLVSEVVKRSSKMVKQGDTCWNLVQQLGFGRIHFKLIPPRRSTRTSSSSTASEASCSSTRSSIRYQWSAELEAQAQDVQTDEVKMSSNQEGAASVPVEVDARSLNFVPLDYVQIWARRKSDAGGLPKCVVVHGALGNRCRLGHNNNFFYLLYASEIHNN